MFIFMVMKQTTFYNTSNYNKVINCLQKDTFNFITFTESKYGHLKYRSLTDKLPVSSIDDARINMRHIIHNFLKDPF